MEVFALANDELKVPDPDLIEGNVKTLAARKGQRFSKPVLFIGVLLLVVIAESKAT